MLSAYEIARTGGKHSGLVRRYQDESCSQIEKAIRSLDRRAAEHLDKINNPRHHVGADIDSQRLTYLVEFYWPKEIQGYREQARVLSELLKERDHGK